MTLTTVQVELPTFELTRNECAFCESVGQLRYFANVERDNAYGLKRDGRDEDVIGAYGEYCVSLWLDRSWRAVVDDPWSEIEGDVGKFQVRTTVTNRNPHLICHDRDDDDAVFILVSRLRWNTFQIEGWTKGKIAKDKSYWVDKAGNGRPAYFFPSNRLYDPASFPRESRS